MNRDVEDTFQGQPLTGDAGTFEGSRQKLLDGLLSQFEDRFSDISEGVLGATSIGNLSTWPTKDNSAGKFILT